MSRQIARLAIVRACYGAAVLVAPDAGGGHFGDMRLSPATRTAMRILGVRQLFQAAVCAVAPTRCVLTLEAGVDAIHAVTMAGVSSVTSNDSRRRVAAVNVGTATVFMLADVIAMRRHRARPGGNTGILRLRDDVAQRICDELPGPVKAPG